MGKGNIGLIGQVDVGINGEKCVKKMIDFSKGQKELSVGECLLSGNQKEHLQGYIDKFSDITRRIREKKD